MRNTVTQKTHAFSHSINEKRIALGNTIATVSTMMLLFVAPLCAADSLFEVVAPKVGQTFAIGSPITVQWVMHNHAAPSGGIMIQISPDEGLTWFYINKAPFGNLDTTAYHDSIGTFTWTIADSVKVYGYGYVHLASATCYVRVAAPYDDGYLPAVSHEFAIVTPAAIVRPNRKSAEGMRLLGSRARDDRGGAIEAVTLNGRCRSATIDLLNNTRGFSAAGVYIPRSRNNAGECVSRGHPATLRVSTYQRRP